MTDEDYKLLLEEADRLVKQPVPPSFQPFKTPLAQGQQTVPELSGKQVMDFSDPIGVEGIFSADQTAQPQARQPASEPFAKLDTNPLKQLMNANKPMFQMDKVDTAPEMADRFTEQGQRDMVTALQAALGRSKKYQDRLDSTLGARRGEQENTYRMGSLKQKSVTDMADLIQKALGLGQTDRALDIKERESEIRDPRIRQYGEYFKALKQAGMEPSTDDVENFRKIVGSVVPQ